MVRRELEQAMIRNMELMRRCGEVEARCEEMKREEARLLQQSRDLELQVECLLGQTAEREGGGRVMASDVITQRLVGFRNVDELCKRNRELLSVAREMGKRLEEMEGGAEAEVQRRLLDVQRELERVRGERSREVELVKMLVEQRDRFRLWLINEGLMDDGGEGVDALVNYRERWTRVEHELEECRLQSMKEQSEIRLESAGYKHRMEMLEQACRFREAEMEECQRQRDTYLEECRVRERQGMADREELERLKRRIGELEQETRERIVKPRVEQEEEDGPAKKELLRRILEQKLWMEKNRTPAPPQVQRDPDTDHGVQ